MCDPLGLNIALVNSNGYYMAYKPITLPYISFMFIEIKFYLLSFLYNIFNKVHEHIQ